MNKSTFSSLALGAALFGVGLPATNALTLDFSSVATGSSLTDASISFDGAGGFSFAPSTGGANSGASFLLSTSSGALEGKVNGTYTIGTPTPAAPSVFQTAAVSGVGAVTIKDSGGFLFTADLAFTTLYNTNVSGSGSSGGFLEGTANLTNFAYTGGDADLVSLLSYKTATDVITFQFVPGLSIESLRSQAVKTSYSGTISTVPVPAAAWLFGSALVGMAGIARRKRQSQKEASAA